MQNHKKKHIRRENTCDPALKLLNGDITPDIQKHKENLWKKHLDAHWEHRHNTHILWNTIHGISNRASPPTLNNNHTQTYCELFHQTIHKHCQTHNTQHTRETHKIQGYNSTPTTTQVQEAIKQSKNNNSQGTGKLNIRHLKHIDPLGLALLTSMLKTALNTNIIPHIWKLANIVPILSMIAKTLEKSHLPYITANTPTQVCAPQARRSDPTPTSKGHGNG